MGRHGTIAGRKEKQDSKRSAMFTKIARAITVAAKNGGDPDYNVALKHAIDKGKAINMPNDNITRAIKKGTGEIEGVTYETGSFEGYGPSGVAVIVDILTDNKNRTTSFIKSTFDKHGGNLGTPGCVSYMFSRKGVIVIEKADGVDEDQLMETALEAGMEDMIVYEDSFEILTEVEDFPVVLDAIKKAGVEILEADVEYLPSMDATPAPEDLPKLRKLIDILEENDDVQKVYHNCAVSLEE